MKFKEGDKVVLKGNYKNMSARKGATGWIKTLDLSMFESVAWVNVAWIRANKKCRNQMDGAYDDCRFELIEHEWDEENND